MISLSKSVISKTLKQKKVLHLTFELSNFRTFKLSTARSRKVTLDRYHKQIPLKERTQ